MCRNKSMAFGLGLIAGVVGGIIAGVLYAPKPGEESRKQLKDAACELYEKNAPAILEQSDLTEIILVLVGFLWQVHRLFGNLAQNPES